MTAGVLFGLSGSSWNRLLEIWAYSKTSLVHRLLPCGQTSAAKGNTSFAGKILLWSIIQGGSRSHYLCLAGKAHKVDVEEGMRDIPDPDVKVKIEKVRSTRDCSYYNCSRPTPVCNANPATLLEMRFLFAPQLFAETDADEYQGSIQDLGEWLVDLGIPSIGQKLDNRSALVRTLVMYFLCYRLVLRPIIMTLSLTLKYSTDVLILSFFSQEWNPACAILPRTGGAPLSFYRCKYGTFCLFYTAVMFFT